MSCPGWPRSISRFHMSVNFSSVRSSRLRSRRRRIPYSGSSSRTRRPRRAGGHPAAHGRDGLVGQLHDVEVVDHQGGVRQVLADGGPVGRAHVDRHRLHAVTPGRVARGQPGPGIGGGAALDLPQQALAAGQIGEPGVPAVGDLLEYPGLGVEREPGPAPAGLIDPQRLHRLRLGGQHRGGPGDERRRHHRPGHAHVPPGRAMVRPPTATAAPAASRSRPVIRAPEGTCGIDSVNDDRTHPD